MGPHHDDKDTPRKVAYFSGNRRARLKPPMTNPQPEGRFANRAIVGAVSGAFSVLLHGGVLAAALYLVDREPGAVTAPTEAISIEFLQTEVLEAIEASTAMTAAASPSSVQSEAGSSNETPASAAPKAVEPVPPEDHVATKDITPAEIEAEAPKGLEVLQGPHPDAELAGKETPHKTAERKRPNKTAKLTEPDAIHKADAKPTRKGAAPSKAAKGSAGSTGRVSASMGSAINYAAIVRARVSARKPAGGGRRGTVVISFGVSRSGGLAFASISRSSGNPGLDSSVLSAVRGAGPFPAPPPGANLRFAIPFYFR
jgi:protein TonB